MRRLFSFLFLLGSLFSFSQSNFSYSLDAGVGGSFRGLYFAEDKLESVALPTGSNDGEALFNYIEEYLNERESHQFAFSINAIFHYQATPKLSLVSGIGYKNIGERFEDDEVLDLANWTGNFIPVYSGKLMIENLRYHYLAIPVEFRYELIEIQRILKGKVGLLGGMSFNFLLFDSFDKSARYETMYKVIYGNPQNLALSANVGLYYEHKLSNGSFIVFAPQISYFFTPNVKYKFGSNDSYIGVNQYNYSYEMKIGYRFNNLFN
ncbi:MAG: hypothetical protein C0599_16235 [Salinivirgaceae bacterium]|nr:MAG: hypothetical protein C0599_16235 [Salinivirgaceae bacterium]